MSRVEPELLRAKLYPAIADELVPRPRLLEKLDQWRRQPLILVSAPAGYGKTTLLSVWLDTLDWPGIWLTLDEHDSKLPVFLGYLLAAVRTRFPHACPQMEELLASLQMPPLQVLANTLINELDQIEQDYTLVLDDYHAIHEPTIHELLVKVLHHPPCSLHLVLATRRDPPLPLVDLRARSLMGEIRVRDLRFTTAEASAFLQQVTGAPVDHATVATLVERTEGWITGLRLLAPAGHSRRDLRDISEGMQDSTRHVREYLIAEVVARQPAAVQDFLLKTSILSRLCAPLADAVCSQGSDPSRLAIGGRQHLEWLDGADLFLIPLDEERYWFRYHHQLQQLLQHELERHSSPAEIATLHMRASEWFAQNGFVEEALSHAWAAGDTMAAVRLVAQHRHEQMQRENWQRIGQWLRQFPQEALDAQPELLMAKAWTLYPGFRLAEMPLILDQIERLVAQLPPTSAAMRSLQGEVDTLRSHQCYLAGDGEGGLSYAQRALESLPREWFYERGTAVMHAAMACQLSGGAGAQALLDRHLADIQLPAEALLYLRLLAACCYIYWTNADLCSLLRVGIRALQHAEQIGLPASAAWAHYYLGVSCYERNNLAEAERHLTAALEQRHTAEGLVAAHSAFGLALTYQAQGRSQQALDTAELISAFLLEVQFPELLPTAQALHAELAHIMRQALAGMLWTKQYYHLDMYQWLKEHDVHPMEAGGPQIRNKDWFHMINHDIISMPDKWEYPWYAAWDLAFHTIALSPVDMDFAKQQLELLLEQAYLHPNGQLPAYEWNFSDVNPPVHAWAALYLYKTELDQKGTGDIDFLKRVFDKLLLNFTWWVNRKDRFGRNVFEGGFLGLDNIGVFDRSAPLPTGGYLEQADGTAWMALYCQNMFEMSNELAAQDPTYEGLALKFAERFVLIAAAINRVGVDGLWDEEDGFYYDVMRLPDGNAIRLKVRSIVGLLPLCATTVIEPWQRDRVPQVMEALGKRLQQMPEVAASIHPTGPGHYGVGGRGIAALVSRERLTRILSRVLDENEFLSPYGIRALSRYHLEHPYVLYVDGQENRVSYLPAESDSGMFGGNSNWRGPIWFPMNTLIIRGLTQYYLYYGDNLKVECPTGSGNMMNLLEVSSEIARRLGHIYRRDAEGNRPVFGGNKKFQTDPHWRDYLLFYEYFHGDNGAGLGASHQTGWTGVMGKMIQLYAELAEAGAEKVLEHGRVSATRRPEPVR